MKNLLILIILISGQALAQLKSPFPSTVKGIAIPNFHNIDNRRSIYRGMAPLGHLGTLKYNGFTDVLIFKNQTQNEVAIEVKELKSRGFNTKNIHHIPFQWANFRSYTKACEQVIDALVILREAHVNIRKKLFFHCTVGEDRTGLLAGLWRMINFGWSAKRAFEEEMCNRGYERGNPNKPWFVVNKVKHYLTPLYKVMSYMISTKRLSYRYMDRNICQYFHKINFERSAKQFLKEDLACKPSKNAIRK